MFYKKNKWQLLFCFLVLNMELVIVNASNVIDSQILGITSIEVQTLGTVSNRCYLALEGEPFGEMIVSEDGKTLTSVLNSGNSRRKPAKLLVRSNKENHFDVVISTPQLLEVPALFPEDATIEMQLILDNDAPKRLPAQASRANRSKRLNRKGSMNLQLGVVISHTEMLPMGNYRISNNVECDGSND